MKLKKEFIIHHTPDEILLVPAGGAGFAGLVKGNKTFGAILDMLKSDASEEDILSSLCSRFDAPEDVIASDVRKALNELRAIGAIDEQDPI